MTRAPKRMSRWSRGPGPLLLMCLMLAGPLSMRVAAQGVPGLSQDAARALTERLEREKRSQEIQDRAFAAIGRGDLAAAQAALEDQVSVDPDNFVPYYNLSCVLAQRGDLDASADRLIQSVEHGFSDKWQVERDPNLQNLRVHDRYRLLVSNWDQIQNAAAEARFEHLKGEYGPRYSYERDEDLRINIASGFDEESTSAAHQEIRFLTEWAIKSIFTDLADPPMSETDPWVTVVLPTKADFLAWAITEYGMQAALGEMSRIGGAYSHDRKQLVSMDLGGTFRHEFLHVLHHRSNTRMGQGHRVWIQEGLCSLVEDYDIVNGELTPTPSWRTNSLKGLERGGGLFSIADLANMSRDRFTQMRPLANYAYARAVFLFLYDKGKLGAWYQDFIQRWSVDPSGVASLEAVLGMDIEQIDAEFRMWLRALPEVPESPTAGGASLGVEIDPGDGEGPVITNVSREARAAGLKVRDVLTSIDGRPTRDYHELCRVLGSFAPGQTLTIAYRRGRLHGEVSLTLGRAR